MENKLVSIIRDLCNLPSPSGREDAVVQLVSERLSAANFDVSVDDIGNVYGTRGTPTKNPLLNAHTDTVQGTFDVEFAPASFKFDGNTIYSEIPDSLLPKEEPPDEYDPMDDLDDSKRWYNNVDWDKIDELELQESLDEREVEDAYTQKELEEFYGYPRGNKAILGLDDKVGIAIILYLAEHTNYEFNALLTTGEEIGCIGARNFDGRIIAQSLWGFSLDRRGSSDIIDNYGFTMAPQRFVDYLIEISEKMGNPRHVALGSFADTAYLAHHIPAVNLSVGYYNEHSPSEVADIHQIADTVKFVERCIDEKDQLHKYGNKRDIPAVGNERHGSGNYGDRYGDRKRSGTTSLYGWL